MTVNLDVSLNRVKRNIGITFCEDQAEVRIWAPGATTVDLVCGEKLLPLEKAAFGYWEAATSDVHPGDRYSFLLDGKNKIADPASLFQPDGVHGVSEAYHTDLFKWEDTVWQNPELSRYIIYEIHTGTFTPEGTFEGIVNKLGYLVELGVIAIELMPVAQFPGARNWGYDGVFPFAVQESYGGPAGLQQLVNACHVKGLAVILDVVYNHLGPEGNYFPVSGPYFTDKYKTPWGSAINFDDAWSDGVRTYFIENALMWFRDFHIDALRMDAVHAIKDFGAVHLLQQLRREVDALMKLTNRRHYLIIECDLNDNKYINPLAQHGYGMDAQWTDEFHHALRVTAGEPATGYYSDFSGVGHLEKAYRGAYIYDGIYSSHRLKTFGNKAAENGGQQFVVFSQNHDQVGNRMLGERSSVLYSHEMQKLMAAAVLCSPFIPLLFMGEEWAETNPFQFFISHGEPELVEAVRKGRKAEFAAFHAEGEAPDPQDIQTFLGSKLSWDLLNTEGHQQMFQYYRALITLRKQYAPLHQTDRKQMCVSSDVSMNCLILQRWDQEQHIVCLMNFSSSIQQISMTAERPYWKKIFDSADPGWKGPAAAPAHINALQDLTIQPQSILVYTSRHV
jgi:maltooligosyltrehalose trehalohydrolase